MRAAGPTVVGLLRRPPAPLLLLLVISLSSCFEDIRSNAQATLPKHEVDALKAIAGKLKIPSTSWDFGVDPCRWAPLQASRFILRNLTCDCNATANLCHVVNIELKGQNLTGVLPEEFGNLTLLTQIDLTFNYINGSIPAAAWASLPLRQLSLIGNRISGTIPEEIGKITTLESLVLEDNLLQGPLPRSLGNLASLTRLLLSANNFTGELPKTLGNLKNLSYFLIDGNGISGKIPSFIGNWKNLDRFDMQGTSLEGPFPSTFASLNSVTQLRVTDLKKTDGSFPPLQDMINMRYLILRNCSISGEIPSYIGGMTNLKTLYGFL